MDHTAHVDASALTHVPETMLIPLCLKAKETREHGIIQDYKAVEIMQQLRYDFTKIEQDWKTQIGIAVRTVLFDETLKTQSERSPLVVVNLGAGLDTRQERFQHLKWYHLDVPEAINIRKQFFQENDKTRFISKSILDPDWMNDVPEREHVLFIAEGLLMYFAEEEVRSVFEQIAQQFRHSFITFNTIHRTSVGQKHTSVDTEQAPLKWGIQSMKDVEAWQSGWKLSKIFYPIDYYKRRWKWMRLLNMIPYFRNGFVIALMETEK